MPETRRIIFSSYVVPTQSVEMEEASIRHTEFQPSPNGTLGGKGTASISATQWGDGWVSFSHENATWDDQGDLWELQGETWSGELSLTTSGVDLTDDISACKFLYIKNTGTTNNVLVALDGGFTYLIVIPPEGSIGLRGDGTQLLCSEVFVKTNTSTTEIEFIIAK